MKYVWFVVILFMSFAAATPVFIIDDIIIIFRKALEIVLMECAVEPRYYKRFFPLLQMNAIIRFNESS